MRTQPGIFPVVLDGQKLIVGAAEDCSLRLAIPGVEPRHCLILAGPHGPIVKAWDQRTWLNDRPVREAGLRDGDRLAIGPVVMRIRKAREDESPARPAPVVESQPPVEAASPLPEPLPNPVIEVSQPVEKQVSAERESRRRQLLNLRARRAALAAHEAESNDLLKQLVDRREELEQRTDALNGLELRIREALAP